MILRLFLTCVMVACLALEAQAGGFLVNEQSARGTALGGALTASLNDPTAIRLNPAALSSLQGTHFSIGATVMMPDYKFSAVSDTAKMQSQVIFPPNIYLTYTTESGLGFAVSATIPYAFRTEWQSDWLGSRIATKSELRSIFLSPTVSYRISSAFSLGLTANFVFSTFQLSHRLGTDSLGQAYGTASVEGDANLGYGVQAGFLYQPGRVLTVGGSYSSRVKIDIDKARATFLDVPVADLSRYPDSKVSTSLSTPDNFSLGVALQPANWVVLEADMQYVLWSSFKALKLKFENSALPEQTLQQDWKNTYAFRCGLEFRLTDVILRGGWHFDQSPVPDAYVSPSLPDADRTGYSFGIGYKVAEGLQLDFAYLFVKFKDRTVTDSLIPHLLPRPDPYLNGTYTTSETVIGLSVSYSWN